MVNDDSIKNAYNAGHDAWINKFGKNPYENAMKLDNDTERKALYQAWCDGYDFARDEENYRTGLAKLAEF